MSYVKSPDGWTRKIDSCLVKHESFCKVFESFQTYLSFLSVMASFFNEMSEEIALDFVTTIRYRTITGPMDNQILQDDLNALSRWEKDWQMSFNMEKNVIQSASLQKKNVVTPSFLMDRDHNHPNLDIILSQDLTGMGRSRCAKFFQVRSRLLALSGVILVIM